MLRSLYRLTLGKPLHFASPPVSGNSKRRISWVIPNLLAVGGLPTEDEEPLFEAAGIQTILALNAASEGQWPPGFEKKFKCQRYILPDRYYLIPLQVPQLAEAVDQVQQSIADDRPVYVHCLAGVERSPTVCIAYLCYYQKMGLWEASYHVKRAFPGAFPSASQLQTIREWLGIEGPNPQA